MNDVLPKPFTKEGLLTMLEKHLSHLKRNSGGIDPMAAPPVPKTNRSLKSEESPATSPATVGNWNSPSNLAGVSPTSNQADDTSIYGSSTPYLQQGLQPPQMYSPAMQMGGPPQQPQPPIRRGIGDISGGGPEMGDMKRHQMYPPQPTGMGQPMQQSLPRPPR